MSNLFDLEDAWGAEMQALCSGTGALTRKQRRVGGRARRVAAALSSTKCLYWLIYSSDYLTSKLLIGLYK